MWKYKSDTDLYEFRKVSSRVLRVDRILVPLSDISNGCLFTDEIPTKFNNVFAYRISFQYYLSPLGSTSPYIYFSLWKALPEIRRDAFCYSRASTSWFF